MYFQALIEASVQVHNNKHTNSTWPLVEKCLFTIHSSNRNKQPFVWRSAGEPFPPPSPLLSLSFLDFESSPSAGQKRNLWRTPPPPLVCSWLLWQQPAVKWPFSREEEEEGKKQSPPLFSSSSGLQLHFLSWP